MDNFDQVKEYIRSQNEKELARIVQNYDFIVGSKEVKYALTKVLPKDANIVYSPFIEDPDLVYAVKKFDILDIFNKEREE
jgi:hypothetical protein